MLHSLSVNDISNNDDLIALELDSNKKQEKAFIYWLEINIEVLITTRKNESCRLNLTRCNTAAHLVNLLIEGFGFL